MRTVLRNSEGQEVPQRRNDVLPAFELQVLREKYPQFAELSRTGQYAQQDAEECWIQLMYSLRERVQVRALLLSSPTW